MKIRNLKLALILSLFFLLVTNESMAQKVLGGKNGLTKITGANTIFKNYKTGKIVTYKYFQSLKGNFVYHKRIKIKDGKDTLLFSLPTEKSKAKEIAREKSFLSQIGKPAKSFYIKDINGNVISSEKLRGKVVVINFWFINCPPCRKEIPHLNQMIKSYKNRNDIVFIGFSIDSKERLIPHLSKHPFDYTIVAESEKIAESFQVIGYPSNFVINKNGIVVHADENYTKYSVYDIEEAIKKVL